MRKVGEWVKLDEKYPVLKIGQEKISQNTRRNVEIVVPTTCVRNEAGFRDFSFDWAYALMRLLTDLPPTMIEGVFSVSSPTEKTVTVTPAPSTKRTSDLGKPYRCSNTPYAGYPAHTLAVGYPACAFADQLHGKSDNT